MTKQVGVNKRDPRIKRVLNQGTTKLGDGSGCRRACGGSHRWSRIQIRGIATCIIFRSRLGTLITRRYSVSWWLLMRQSGPETEVCGRPYLG